ncbi:MAG: tyrosine-type recombinase/integrase [Candidatus Binataceae bacterium]|nr:tyrosine-type recombinase/integrase [Candidatus Binataceae bacterium]
MRNSLSAATVVSERLAPARGRRVIWDRKTPGFGLRVTVTGHKTWVVLYRMSGKLRWLTLGTYPPVSLADARKAAKDALADVHKGIDPVAEKQSARAADTFGALAARYLKEWAREMKKPGSVREDERNIGKELLPIWGTRKANEIQRRDVIALVDSIAARGAKIHANRVLALVSKIFNFGFDKEIVDMNPARLVKKPGKEHQRDRVLQPAEIRAIWESIDAESADTAALFKLLLLTGQRPGEVRDMPWSEVDLESGWWTIPKERTKSKVKQRLPLVGIALEILHGRSSTRDSEYVFPGRFKDDSLASHQKQFARIIERSKVDFQARDLRRTLATNLAELGVERMTIKKILNHSEGKDVTAIYERHSYDKEKREALLRWERRLKEIVGVVVDRPKVVPLRS